MEIVEEIYKVRQDNVKTGAQKARICQEISNTLAKFQNKLDGRSDRASLAKCHIQLTKPDKRPINPAPYCTELKTRGFEAPNLGKRLYMGFMEPAQLKFAF